MPSLSASVPANKLKVMRQGPSKPASRPGVGGSVPGATGAGGGVVSGVGRPVNMSDPATQATIKLAGNAGVRGLPATNPAPPTLNRGGGGFQVRPRDIVGGSPLPGAGVGGGADIQTAIQNLRGQLGGPTPTVEPGAGAGADASVSSGAMPPAAPAWKQLADMGVGGQGSAQANRAKLAELLAARMGGSASGADIGQGIAPPGMVPARGPRPSMPLPPPQPGLLANPMPGTIPDETPGAVSASIGDATAAYGGTAAPANPYMDILGRRLGGFGGTSGGAGRPGGGYGSGGFSPIQVRQ